MASTTYSHTLYDPESDASVALSLTAAENAVIKALTLEMAERGQA